MKPHQCRHTAPEGRMLGQTLHRSLEVFAFRKAGRHDLNIYIYIYILAEYVFKIVPVLAQKHRHNPNT